MKKILFAPLLLLFAFAVHAQQPVNGNYNWNGQQLFSGPTEFKGPIPWTDVRMYGARLLPSSDIGQITTATCNGTNSVSVAGVGDFIVGDGIVVSQCGPATSQSTPAAPTATVVGATGSKSIPYKLIGVDASRGLTVPGSAVTVTNASNVFGDIPHILSSVTGSSNTITLTIGSSNPFPASSGSQCAIVMNVSGMTPSPNGIQTITYTSTTTATFTLTGATGSGTLGANSAVWLADCQPLSAISRSTAGVITATTVNNNDFVANPSAQLISKVWIEGITPTDLDGPYDIVSTPAANQFTTNTKYTVAATENGSAIGGSTTSGLPYWNQMGAIVYPEIALTTPTPSGNTQFYIVCANYGSGYVPIGQTLPGDNIFEDWGPWWAGGYLPDPNIGGSNVCLNSGTQAQEYVGTITNISGTTFTVNPSTSQTASTVAAFHDNSIAIQNAGNTACTASNGNGGGTVYLPGGNGDWIFNASFPAVTSSCPSLAWRYGSPLYSNGGIDADNLVTLNLIGDTGYGSATSGTTQNYVPIYGEGSTPFFWMQNANHGIQTQGVSFNLPNNGQVGLFNNGELARMNDTVFYAAQNTTARGLVNIGGAFRFSLLGNSAIQGYPGFAYWNGGSLIPNGMIEAGPLIGLIQSGTTSATGPAGIYVDGVIQGVGRGIEFTGIRGVGSASLAVEVDNFQNMQAPWTPLLWFNGQQIINSVLMKHNVPDSNNPPLIANFGGVNIQGVTLVGNYATEPLIGGDGFSSVVIDNDQSAISNNTVGQNVNVHTVNANGNVDIGPFGSSATFSANAADFINMPLSHGSFPDFWPLAAPAFTATTTSCSSGCWAAQTWIVQVVGVNWDGAEVFTIPNPSVNVTTNGSQAISVTVTTPLSGALQGYLIYVDGARQGNAILTAGTTTLNGDNPFGTGPSLPGGGSPQITPNGFEGFQYRLFSQSGTFKDDLTGTFTANRTATLPDASGTICLTTTCTGNQQQAGCQTSTFTGTITNSAPVTVASCNLTIPSSGASTFVLRAEYSIFASSTNSPIGINCWVTDGASPTPHSWAPSGHYEPSAQNGAIIPLTMTEDSHTTYNQGAGTFTISLECQESETTSGAQYAVQSSPRVGSVGPTLNVKIVPGS